MLLAALAGLALAAQSPRFVNASSETRTIVGAAGWRLTIMRNAPPEWCVAKLPGGITTTIGVTPDGGLALGAERPDWRNLAPRMPVMLRIDRGPPTRFTAMAVGEGLFVVTHDRELGEKVLRARRLDWVIPGGHYGADVNAMRAAFAATYPCNPVSGPPRWRLK